MSAFILSRGEDRPLTRNSDLATDGDEKGQSEMTSLILTRYTLQALFRFRTHYRMHVGIAASRSSTNAVLIGPCRHLKVGRLIRAIESEQCFGTACIHHRWGKCVSEPWRNQCEYSSTLGSWSFLLSYIRYVRRERWFFPSLQKNQPERPLFLRKTAS
jgi:hypothetical protein